MKQTLTSLLIMLAIGLVALGCSSDGSSDSSQPHAVRFTQSGCKKAPAQSRGGGIFDAVEEIVYKALPHGKLLITHQNAAFSCEPKIVLKSPIQDDRILIYQTDTDPRTNCICLYDLGIEVGPLTSGHHYTLVIAPGNPAKAEIPITYSPALSGSFVCKNE